MREGNGMEGEREGGLEAVVYVEVVFFLRCPIFCIVDSGFTCLFCCSEGGHVLLLPSFYYLLMYQMITMLMRTDVD